MGIISAAKGDFVKTLLEKFTHGDSGSSILGVAAAAILGSGVSFGDLFSQDQTKQLHAGGLVAGAVVVAVWGYFIGKPKTSVDAASVDSKKDNGGRDK